MELQPGASASEAELVEHCRRLLPGFKAPRTVVFTEIPKTSTGKIQSTSCASGPASTAAIE